MALKATIYKATLQIADIDHAYYADHALTLARHPSETDERMMMRLLAFALCARMGNAEGLELAKDMWEPDEPALWQRDLTGAITHWVEVGLPDDKRLLKACGRAAHVTLLAYGHTVDTWWKPLAGKLSRAQNLHVLQVPNAQSKALAQLAARSLQLQVTMQEGTVMVSGGAHTLHIDTHTLMGSPAV